jgi:hypothetical protein
MMTVVEAQETPGSLEEAVPMSVPVIPVDGARFGQCLWASCELKLVDGVPKKSADGTPQFLAQAFVVPEAIPGERTPKPGTLEVTITNNKAPDLAPMTPCVFEDLVCREWAMNGRHGVAFSASGVRPASSPAGPGAKGGGN